MRAAFQQGNVDAWAIWDPYYSAALLQGGARVLTDGTDLKQTDPSILLPGPTLNAMALSLKAYSTPLLRPMP